MLALPFGILPGKSWIPLVYNHVLFFWFVLIGPMGPMASTFWLRLPTTCDSLWSLVHRTDLPLLVYQPTGGQRTIPAYWVQTLQHGLTHWKANHYHPESWWFVIHIIHYMYICILYTSTICIWLVLSTPLKNISQLGWLFPIYGKIKNVPNHQPGI